MSIFEKVPDDGRVNFASKEQKKIAKQFRC